ncbi:hypothetical protein D1AOALGA4SA_13111 [Olavius algarvensis Delta 1 endosymbiont]|nr:hypothetical protein D1AOALGA4SA_13111 [Olavius algarvensis Delta 1 endosymbiont]
MRIFTFMRPLYIHPELLMKAGRSRRSGASCHPVSTNSRVRRRHSCLPAIH